MAVVVRPESGKGDFTFRSGMRYKGTHHSCSKHTAGRSSDPTVRRSTSSPLPPLPHPPVSCRLEGEWKARVPHGHGVESYPCGDSFEGQFQHGHRHGEGTETHVTGDKFTGQYARGTRNGRGTFEYRNGDRYEG